MNLSLSLCVCACVCVPVCALYFGYAAWCNISNSNEV